MVPILGATKPEQLADNLGAVEAVLQDDWLAGLERVSRVEPGFPHDFLRFPAMRDAIYGDRWQQVDDLRTTARRVPADDRYGAA